MFPKLFEITIVDIIGIVISAMTFIYVVVFGQKNIRDWLKKRKSRRINHAHSRYLNEVISNYHQIDIQFVEPNKQLAESSTVPDAWNLQDDSGSPLSKSFFEVAHQHPRFILLGEGGSGKTTMLRKFAFDLASGMLHEQNEENLLIPVIIPLGNYVKVGELKKLVRSKVESISKHLASYFNEYLKEGNFWFLFDGLDEIPKTGFVDKIETIKNFIEEFPDNRFIIASRDASYKYNYENNQSDEQIYRDVFEYPKISLMPLEKDQQEKFLANYLSDLGKDFYIEIPRDKIDEKFLSKPYFLRILAHLIHKSKKLPTKVKELMASFVDTRIKVEASRETWKHKNVQVLYRSITHIALNLAIYGYGGASVSSETLSSWLPDKLWIDQKPVQQDENDKHNVLYFAKSANLLQEENKDSFRFIHQLIYECFLEAAEKSEPFLDYVFSYRGDLEAGEKKLISTAISLAAEVHAEDFRKSGDKYVFHAIAAGLITVKYIDPFNAELIAAAIVHDISMNKEEHLIKIKDKLNGKIYELVKDSLKFSKKLSDVSIDDETNSDQNKVEALKLLEEFSKESVTIKLVESLHNIQTIRFMSDKKQVKYAKRTNLYYIPLAQHLGYHELVTEFRNVVK